MLIIEIQHANPYYDDSYAVNSANLGPYGDAITYELIPHIEKKFRGHRCAWARFMYGGSTGGWEALAAQMFYPDEYNGAFAACPDPIDFRAYTVVDIYKDRTRTSRRSVEADAAARARATISATSARRGRHESPRAGPRDEEPLGRPVGYLGGRLFPGRAGRLSEAASGTSGPA